MLLLGVLVSWRRAPNFLNLVAFVHMFVTFNHSQACRDTVLDQERDSLISEKLGKSMMATTADKHQMFFL